ncbi:MAG: DUF1491 family protein [Hyphomicrobiales bacterium]
MRLRSDLWVSAYLRRCAVEGVAAVLRRRGAPEAGAIFVKVDRLDGGAALYGPAPTGDELPRGVDRLFARQHGTETLPPAEIEARLARQRGFDPDIWIVEVEDRDGRSFLDLGQF